MGVAAKLRVNARHRPRRDRVLQVIQPQARADAEAGGFGGEFYARPVHLFRTAMDDEFHKDISPITEVEQAPG